MYTNITGVLCNVKNWGSLIKMNLGYKVLWMKYGERLKAARKHADLTQGELAELIGNVCTQENISKLERGNATGSEYTAQFADACGISPIWLATGKGPMTAGHLSLDAITFAEAWDMMPNNKKFALAQFVGVELPALSNYEITMPLLLPPENEAEPEVLISKNPKKKSGK